MLHGHDKIGMLEFHDINIPFVSCINKCHPFETVFPCIVGSFHIH